VRIGRLGWVPADTLLSVSQVVFRDPIKYKLNKELFIASEGVYSGQVRGRAVQGS
jgi:hypothetical protein